MQTNRHDTAAPPWQRYAGAQTTLTKAGAEAVAVHVAMRHIETESVMRWAPDGGDAAADVTGGALHGGDLANGTAGTAMLLLTLARHASWERWQEPLHRHLSFAVRRFVDRGELTQVGLYSGIAGILAVARIASGGTHYRSLIASLERSIADSAGLLASSVTEARTRAETMVGLAGVLIALERGSSVAQLVEGLLCAVLDEMIPFQDDTGVVNLSMSHGLSGPLAALALRGVTGDGERLARDLAKTIVSAMVRSRGGVLWPGFVRAGEPELVRSAWCYGTPGTAVALMHASARFDLGLERVLCNSLDSVWAQGRTGWGSDDDGVCHGVAGIAACFLAAAQLNREYERFGLSLLGEAQERFDSRRPTGYRVNCQPYGWVESGSFLTGSTGIATALMSAANEDRDWLRLLALA